jgi:chromate transporter
MQAVFYGVGAAVTGIIVVSSYKLTIKSIGKFNTSSLRQNWLLWLFFLFAFIITIITQSENIFIFLGAGFIYMAVKSPPKFISKPSASLPVFLFFNAGFWQFEWPVLSKIAWFFTKAGAFVFGSGLAIVPFLHSGVVIENHWLNEKQFLDAIAVAMITPGPVVITVGFIGYLVAGFPGASVAALATFLPCYLITVAAAPHFTKIAKNNSIKAFVDGVTAAVVGALAGAVVIIATRSITDIKSSIIAVLTILSLLYVKKVKEPYIIFAAALLGLLVKSNNWLP